ncbi:MAG: hypothetical protein KKF41_06210 [Actinobacteria bacterium]|nr:hypothetical protein [Actinomycetota bacterium]MBU2687158.1 hypothetical protein [Actinomycetota bacterium]
MAGSRPCHVCAVPRRISRSLTWNPEGTITETRDPEHRMILADVEGINQLFGNIENLIGISIQNMLTESKARATREFTRKLLRGWKRQVVRRAGLGLVIKRMGGLARSFGYGDLEVLHVDWRNNRIEWRLRDPYSVPLMCGDLRGATEAVKDVVGTVEAEPEGENTYIVRGRLSPPPSGMEERLTAPAARVKRGDITYRRCPDCGVPLRVSGFAWDPDCGIIRDGRTGARYAFIGPASIQAVFDELASELGESIPEAVVEAQRMRVASLDFEPWRGFALEKFRDLLGVMGFGNLVSLESSPDRFTARIENAALPLVIAGTAAGALEAFTGRRATTEWTVTPDGDLELQVTA